MRKTISLFLILFLVSSLFTPPVLVSAETIPDVPEEPSNAGFVNVLGVDSTAFPDVVVYVTVDTEKGMAGNLTADDFEIYENNVPQRIVSIGKSGTSTRALDVVFLIDTSGSMDDEIGTLRDRIYSIASNLSEAGYDVRFAIVGFETDPRLYLNFTSNVSLVKDALGEIHVSGGTENNFYALEWVLNMSFRPLASKMIVDITDEDDDTGWINVTQVAGDLIENSALFVGISDPWEDRYTPESVMNLTERVGGLWIDIHSGDFGGFSTTW